MTEQARIRRLQDTLYTAGNGVIAFGVWSLAKVGLFLMLANEKMLRQLLGMSSASLTITVWVLLGVIIIIDAAIRAYVGLSARAEGRGEKRGSLYLVVAAIAAIANGLSLVALALSTSFTLPVLVMIATIIIEATASASLALVVFTALRLRNMSKTKG